MDTPTGQSPRDHAARLAETLRDVLGLDPPPNFEPRFIAHARRVGPSNVEDLGSLLLLECLEERDAGRPMDGPAILRALERVVKRLERAARREVPLTFAPADPRPPAPAPDEDRLPAELRDAIVSRLTFFHGLFLETYLDQDRERKRVERIERTASELGMSRSAAYDLMREVKGVLGPLLGKKAN